MIGTFNGNERVVHTFRKCKNLNTERAHDRYEMDPLCQLKAQQEFAGGPLEIVGIYHSHPDHPSRASQTDTDAAHAGYSYVIVSVQKGTVASAQSWDLNEAEKKFYEEPLVMTMLKEIGNERDCQNSHAAAACDRPARRK